MLHEPTGDLYITPPGAFGKEGNMTHYGDITKLNGFDLPIVDCITGGSPCQDLSVAGKRAGLDGERSGLFMEQIRIVKEMREHDRTTGRANFNLRPRYMVWENVPGAFSSNGGKDFQAVLTEIIRIIEPEAPDVPMPTKRWDKAGCLYDELGGWSVAWRVHDAQFWGVPQRRKRIALVADFGGLSAPEILFERKGMSGDIAESGAEREGTAGATAESTGSEIGINGGAIAGKPGGGKGILIQREHTGALSTLNNQNVYCLNDQGDSVMATSKEKTGALRAQEHVYQPLVMSMQAIGEYKESEKASALKQRDHKDATDLVVSSIRLDNGSASPVAGIEVSPTIRQGAGPNGCANVAVAAVDCRNGSENEKTNGTFQAKSTGGIGLNFNNVCRQNNNVRRLTPMECERLQGFPDGWTDIGEWVDTKGKKHKEADGPRYKALGNSIALPFWFWLLRRISAQYERPATLGSLFDGIGGFPLCWERCNGKGTAIWASEIEEFPIAVTNRHFGG